MWLTVIWFCSAGFIVKLGRNILGFTLWEDIFRYCSSWSCLCKLTLYKISVHNSSYQHVLWAVPLNVIAIDCHRCIFLQFHWKWAKFKCNTTKYNIIIRSSVHHHWKITWSPTHCAWLFALWSPWFKYKKSQEVNTEHAGLDVSGKKWFVKVGIFEDILKQIITMSSMADWQHWLQHLKKHLFKGTCTWF